MAIANDITWRSLAVNGAVLRIRTVEVSNSPLYKSVEIFYEVYTSTTAYSNQENPIEIDSITLNSIDDPVEFAQFKSKMQEVGEDIISASYVAVKQLADWSGATDEDLGDE